ncbi:hypothetical protein C1S79_24605 [Mycolicibacterium phocaicum]|uniref:Uncharacterized protein n=1 Tax=Mycolicibacterium phocaicum TaxID=319706 RepID=A0AA94R6B8_9MYCO|nr:hypothetical protein C1S79_24605 [Mycolicibacterium phocaicum]
MTYGHTLDLMGEMLKVDDEGLCVLAGQCDSAAAEFVGGRTDRPAGPAGQATTAAVSRGHDTVTAAAAVFARRMTASGVKLRAAAASYVSADCGSNEHIAAAGRSIEV